MRIVLITTKYLSKPVWCLINAEDAQINPNTDLDILIPNPTKEQWPFVESINILMRLLYNNAIYLENKEGIISSIRSFLHRLNYKLETDKTYNYKKFYAKVYSTNFQGPFTEMEFFALGLEQAVQLLKESGDWEWCTEVYEVEMEEFEWKFG